MKILKLSTYRDYSIFFWIVLISIVGIITFIIHTQNQQQQLNQIQSSLDNIYLKKTLKEIVENLKPRFNKIRLEPRAIASSSEFIST